MHKTLAKNKKAYHDYEVLNDYEAGIVLLGGEVKATKQGRCNLKGSFINCFNNEAWANEMHISRYKFSNDPDYNPTRKRKLLLHKREISKIHAELKQKGITAIPLEILLKNNKIKVKIGICKGKKLYDKRKDLKKKAQDKEIARAMKAIHRS